MLTREILDEVLPDSDATWKLAEHLTGVELADRSKVLTRGLRWLADFVEGDRFPVQPDWARERHAYPFPITMRGLEYKSASQYLTAEGWPLGTRCWYVCIDSEWHQFAAAETPEMAIVRAMIVMSLLKLRRETPPEKRTDLFAELDKLTPNRGTACATQS
jgi:hypothetical protein